MSTDMVLREARERQLRLYRHVVRHPKDPTQRTMFSVFEWLDHAEGPTACFMVAPGGVQSEGYEHGGPASAWAMARWRPKEYRRKVDGATRCSGVCPI